MNEVQQRSAKIQCGIDFHKNTCRLRARTMDGQDVEKVTIRTDRLLQYLSNRKDWRIGIEATGGVNIVAEKLKEQGHEVVIFNSNKFRGIGIGGKKTDDRDALALAEAMRLNAVPEVHLRSKYAREVKTLLVGRELVVRTRTQVTNHIRGTLREYAITIPVGKEAFFEQAGAKIALVPDPMIRMTLEMLLENARLFRSQEKEVEARLLEKCKNDERLALLQTIPGVGIMTALAMIAVVDDISRFKNAKEFASYLGLVPSVSASADKCMMGSITRSGSEILRRYLIHGARAWLRYSAEKSGDQNRAWAEKIKGRRGQNKATVALAHRIARICFAVLRDKTPYQKRAA